MLLPNLSGSEEFCKSASKPIVYSGRETFNHLGPFTQGKIASPFSGPLSFTECPPEQKSVTTYLLL